jgi:hypothetical protein
MIGVIVGPVIGIGTVIVIRPIIPTCVAATIAAVTDLFYYTNLSLSYGSQSTHLRHGRIGSSD